MTRLTSDLLADKAVTAPKLNTGAATAGQVFRADGTGGATLGNLTAEEVGADVLGAAATVQGNLTAHIGLTSGAHGISAYGATIVAATTAAAARTVLELGTAALANTGDFAPIGHVGAGGTAHAVATTSNNGFMSSDDKTKLDGLSGLSIATTAEAQAGTNNTSAISPLRLREAFNASGTAPVYACRAWVSFDGIPTTPAVHGSGNVSSVTKNDTSDYTINFSTAMPDANYAVAGCGRQVSGMTRPDAIVGMRNFAPTTTSVRIGTTDGNTSRQFEHTSVSIFR